MHRFLSASGVDRKLETAGKLRARIDFDLHKIEKGLALSAPTPGFGTSAVATLLQSVETYAGTYGDTPSISVALHALRAYLEFHETAGGLDEALKHDIQVTLARIEARGAGGGVLPITRQDVLAHAQRDLQAFFDARHSIRQFTAEGVDPTWIERAVRMAQRTPSVCNRQGPKVHVYSDPVDRRRMLACQRGNAGFGDQAKVLLVVTVDLETFISVGERNQAWIDGGMFAMTLIWALHSLGLGTCALNWSAEHARDAQVHEVGNIPTSEVVIMMIAVGHIPERLLVARSVRKPLHEVLRSGTTQEPSE